MAAVDAWGSRSLHDFRVVVLVVLIFGVVPAAVIGSVGALVVHLLTWRATSQAWGVAGAAIAGLVAGFLLYRESGPALMLGLAAGVGRLVVVPLATRRSRVASA